MNHRAKRRKSRMNLRPEVIRHKQREENRAKLRAKLNGPANEDRKKFVDPPAAEVAPLFPMRIEETTGVKVVEAGRKPTKPTPFWQSPPKYMPVKAPMVVVISQEAIVVDVEAS